MRLSLATIKMLRVAFGGRELLWLYGEGDRLEALEKWEKRQAINQRYHLKKRLASLQEKGIIILQGERVRLTKKGKKLLAQAESSELTIRKSKWRGRWQIIAYDIPNHKKKERDTFRQQLKRWRLYRIQESIWVTPYECKEEVAVVAQSYGISPYVLYMRATDLPMADKLKRVFDLT